MHPVTVGCRADLHRMPCTARYLLASGMPTAGLHDARQPPLLADSQHQSIPLGPTALATAHRRRAHRECTISELLERLWHVDGRFFCVSRGQFEFTGKFVNIFFVFCGLSKSWHAAECI